MAALSAVAPLSEMMMTLALFCSTAAWARATRSLREFSSAAGPADGSKKALRRTTRFFRKGTSKSAATS